jgi:ribosome biogenesis protein Tsr3
MTAPASLTALAQSFSARKSYLSAIVIQPLRTALSLLLNVTLYAQQQPDTTDPGRCSITSYQRAPLARPRLASDSISFATALYALRSLEVNDHAVVDTAVVHSIECSWTALECAAADVAGTQLNTQERDG